MKIWRDLIKFKNAEVIFIDDTINYYEHILVDTKKRLLLVTSNNGKLIKVLIPLEIVKIIQTR